MNLWSLDGRVNQLNLSNNQKIVVTIDQFKYTPSGETHVPDGGSCTKHCHCADSSECSFGTCVSTSNPGQSTPGPTSESSQGPTLEPSPEPSMAPTAVPEPGTTSAPSLTFAPQAQPTSEPSLDPTVEPTQGPQDSPEPAACSAYSRCAHLANDCCPTRDGIYLACCFQQGSAPAPAPPTGGNSMAACSAYDHCDHLAGDCCPTRDGVFLYCCFH